MITLESITKNIFLVKGLMFMFSAVLLPNLSESFHFSLVFFYHIIMPKLSYLPKIFCFAKWNGVSLQIKKSSRLQKLNIFASYS